MIIKIYYIKKIKISILLILNKRYDIIKLYAGYVFVI